VLVTIPKALIKDCEVVDAPQSKTLEDLAQDTSEALLAQYEEVAKCNSRLKQARALQEQQEKLYGK